MCYVHLYLYDAFRKYILYNIDILKWGMLQQQLMVYNGFHFAQFQWSRSLSSIQSPCTRMCLLGRRQRETTTNYALVPKLIISTHYLCYIEYIFLAAAIDHSSNMI